MVLKGGAVVLAGSMLAEGAAEAGNRALKEQARALRAAMAERAALRAEAPRDADDHYAGAKAMLALGDLPGAMGGFRRVLAETPDSVDAMNGLAVVYDRMGRHDLARGWYDAALAVAPGDGAVLANLGLSLGLQGEWRAAIPFLRAAAASDDPVAVAAARRLLARASAEIVQAEARAPVPVRPAEIALVPAGLPPEHAMALADSGSAASLSDVFPGVVVVPAPVMVPGNVRAEMASAAMQPAAALFSGPAGPLLALPEGQAQSRIERLSSGEAVLVMDAAPPPVELAALGDAAVLVLLPSLPSSVEAAAPAPSPVGPVRIGMPPAAGVPGLVAAAMPDLTGTLADAYPARAHVEAMAAILAGAAGALALAPDTPVLRASVMPAPVVRAEPAARAVPAPDAMPAWLVHLRVTGGQRRLPATPSRLLEKEPQTRPFDSDDMALNLLAARLVGKAPPGSDAARQAAIARLERLIERARQA